MKPTRQAGTLRDVKESIGDVERKMQDLAVRAQESDTHLKQLRNAIADYMYFARRADVRARVVCFVGSLLKDAVGGGLRKAANELCWQICAFSWSLSFQDVELYPAPAVAPAGPVVLMLGFAGSHIDDLRPAAEHWVRHYGAAVLITCPSTHGRFDQIQVAHGELMRLLAGGRPLVLHVFSNGGFGMLGHFVQSWKLALKRGTAGTADLDAICCVVFDSVGLVDEKVLSRLEPGEGSVNLADDRGAYALYLSMGYAAFMHYGACEAFTQEPAVSFAKSLWPCIQSGRVQEGAKKFAREPAPLDILAPLLGAPLLVVYSEVDKIVPSVTSENLLRHFREAPGRAEAVCSRHPGAGEDLLGEDGLAVHALRFDETPHIKHFGTHPDQYWEAVAPLARAAAQA